MKKLLFVIVAMMALVASQTLFTACNDGETYAEMKEKEKKAVNKFIRALQ